MTYLYHRLPGNMKGTVLQPLNALRETDPEIYAAHAAKYEGREEIMDQLVPTLNCRWNDVIHLSAIPPGEVEKAFQECGEAPPKRVLVQIDPNLLMKENTTVFLYQGPMKDLFVSKENWAAYNPEDIEKYSVLPEETKAYYKECFLQGNKPLLWHRVPHILYKGSIDISDLPVITS